MAPDASTSPVEWGPEIRVDGKQPAWLTNQDRFSWYGCTYRGTSHDWQGVERIRLPADHPHYRQPTTPERDPALWDRMVALVREMASKRWELADNENYQEARAIVADLPKPVDPDLIEAREIAASMLEVAQGGTHIEETRRGERDGYVHVCIALAGIQRGRELAAPEVSHVG